MDTKRFQIALFFCIGIFAVVPYTYAGIYRDLVFSLTDGQGGTVIGYWSFDDPVGSTTAANLVPGGNPATVQGNPGAVVFGQPGAVWFEPDNTSVWLDGDTGYFRVAKYPALQNFGPKISLTGWVRLTPKADSGPCCGLDHILYADDLGSMTDDYYLLNVFGPPPGRGVSGAVEFGNTPGTNWHSSGSVSVMTGDWAFVAATYDGTTGQKRIYINGRLVSDATVGTGGFTTSTRDLLIGGGAGNREAKGQLDEFAVFNFILTPTQVRQMYQTGAPALVGYWPMNEGAGSTTADLSYQHNDGTLVNTTWVQDPQRGTVLEFDGTGYVDIPSGVTELGDGDFSIAAWIKTPSSGAVALLSKSDNDSSWEYREKQFYLAGGTVRWVGHSANYLMSNGPTVNDNQWHHVVVTWDVDTHVGKIYVDGRETTLSRMDYNGLADAVDHLARIGFDTSGEAASNFIGRMDDVAVFRRTLSLGEIARIMEGNFQQYLGIPRLPPYEEVILASQPVVYYRFNEQPGATQAVDSSGHGHHATYYGDAATVPSDVGIFMGRAVRLDGTGDYLRMTDTLPAMNEMSIEAWIYAQDLDNWDAIVNHEGWTANDVHLQFHSSGELEFSINGNSPMDQFFTYPFAEDQWYHIVLTYSQSAKEVQLFVNGDLQERLSYTTALPAEIGPFWIGAWENERFFNGMIDELAIYDRVLTATEVWTHYLAGIQVPEPMSMELAAAGLLAFLLYSVRKHRKDSFR